MISIIIKKIVGYWVSAEIIVDADRDIYEYGLELLLFSAINLSVIIATAIFTKRLPESIALIVSVIPLQSFGGGYHAKTHLRCFLIMYVGWWVVMWLIPYLTPLATTFTVGISLVIIFIFAPVSHENVTLSCKQRLKMKNLVRAVAAGIAIMSIIGAWLVIRHKNIISSLAIGMGVVAFSMLAAQFKRMAGKFIM